MSVSAAHCAAVGALIEPTHWLARARVFVELTKPRLTGLAVLSTLAGFYLGREGGPWLPAFMAILIGASLVGGGANALNQYMERDLDARMRRTASRPLPSGRLEPQGALGFGLIMASSGVGFLAVRVNLLTGLLALLTVLTYLFIYTPLKRSTPWSTVAGTIPGALPILMGWTAAGRQITPVAWALFAIVAVWQLPHFFAIGWLHREDYRHAGCPLWPGRDDSGRLIALASTLLCALLIPISLLPARWGLTGGLYGGVALAAGIGFLAVALAWAIAPSVRAGRRVFHASIVLLPLLLLFMAVNAR